MREELIRAALEVQRRAYAPHSRFEVGAAVMTAANTVHFGCNVENASYGLTICAERSAVCQMIAAGQREIRAIAVASPGGVSPCGACRQVLLEFGSDFEVILFDSATQKVTHTWRIADLLPGAFRLDS